MFTQSDTHTSESLPLDSRNVHKSTFGYDTMNGHIVDTMYVSYCGAFQNLMFLSSKFATKNK